MATQRIGEGLRVQLFGDARLVAPGTRVDLTPHQVALLALVYGHGDDGLSRPSAVRHLWGNAASRKGRHRVRQLLFELRSRVDRPIIGTSADFLRPLAEVASDLGTFEAGLKGGSLQQAALLVARGFLAGMDPPSETYADWRDGKAVGMHRTLRATAFARWSRAHDSGEFIAACDAAEALFILDPSDVGNVERVIRARGRAGDLEGAQRGFADYLSRLPSGSEPDPAVTHAIEALRSIGRIAALAPNDSVAVPFVGRTGPMRRALRSLHSVESGGCHLVLISGESGIGKTRVMQEVRKEAAVRGFRCLTANPAELEHSIPLNCLLDALRDVELDPHLAALGPPWSSVVASLLPPGTLRHPPEEPPPIQPSSLSRRLLDSFSLLFERLARERPTLLFIDDLQWADATTIAILQFFQRRWTEVPFGVFATLRPDLVRVADPVAQYLTADGGVRSDVIELPTLTTEEAQALVRALGGARIDERIALRLGAMAGHHPLYLAELTREFLAGGVTLPDSALDHLQIPPSLGRMLDARLESMSDRAVKVAGVLAVAARPLCIEVVAQATNLSLQETLDAVDALVRARFVALDRREARIAHELFRSAVYRHISEARRALHHRAIARWLLEDASDESAGEAAIHYFRAGDDELAAKYGWGAARRAFDAGALAEAIQFYEVVVESERDPRRQADATAELARALYLARDITRANPRLHVAAEQFRATGRRHEARRLEILRIEGLAEVAQRPVTRLLKMVSDVKREARHDDDWETIALALDTELHLLHRIGDVAGIRIVLEQMRACVSQGNREAQLLSKAGLALGVFFGDPVEAVRAAQEAVELAAHARGYRLRALARYMIVLHARGELTLPKASTVVAEARSLAEASGDVLERFAIESNVAVSLLDAGDIAGAELMMERAATLAGAGEMDLHRFIRANNRSELALAMHDFEAARRGFSEASAFLGPTTPSYMQDLVNAGLGYCAIEMGDLSEVRLREEALSTPPASWYFDPTTLITFRARLLERRGRWADALTMIEGAATDIEGRIVLAWFKLRLLQIRIMIKHGHPDAAGLAANAGKRADAMGLTLRADEFRRLGSSARKL